MMEIKTNNCPRGLVSVQDMPEKDRADFDYIDENAQFTARVFRYRGAWYDVNEFVRIVKRSAGNMGFCHGVDDDSPLLQWNGIQTDTHFSGVVVRYVDGFERVIMGSVYA